MSTIVSASMRGASSVKVTVIRRQIGRSVRRTIVRTPTVFGELFTPPDRGPHPGIVVLGGSEGGYPTDLPAMLASHGFAALSIAYFGEPDQPKDLVGVPIETVRAAAEYLVRQHSANVGGVGVLGVSRGGELALLAAAHFRSIRAVVAIVPSPIVEAGLRFGTGPVDASAWTYAGNPVPFATFPQIERFLQIGDEVQIAPSLIQLGNINGPVEIVTAGDDQLGFSGALFTQFLKQHPLRSGDGHVNYAAAGHLIDIPYTPTANLSELRTPYGVLHFGGNPQAYAVADADSWPRILSFLHKSLSH
ncbi:MAG: hypothetical protein M3Y21_03440 [Candidatus Eremiobacteraeota bacterium]|nr:hypothetical protein [Candidatus Eremiobacteraeota bacterium]